MPAETRPAESFKNDTSAFPSESLFIRYLLTFAWQQESTSYFLLVQEIDVHLLWPLPDDKLADVHLAA